MGYKLLLAGKNNMIIDDFFDQIMEGYELMSTSNRYRDMTKHIDVFAPNMMVYCIYNETDDDYKRLMEIKRKLIKQEISLAIVGSVDDCAAFQSKTNNMADLILEKPITVEAITEHIHKCLVALDHQREELKRMKEEQAQKEEQNRRKHVLVIDDDPLMLKLIKEYLHDDYDVATAISGKIAYKFLESRKTDMILLDYEMPVENGPQVMEKLRENPELASVPILFLTGTTDAEKVKDALSHKPQGYMLKPIDQEKLVNNVKKFLG